MIVNAMMMISTKLVCIGISTLKIQNILLHHGDHYFYPPQANVDKLAIFEYSGEHHMHMDYGHMICHVACKFKQKCGMEL